MGDAQSDARLLWELDVEGIGGQMVVADVNGDGKLEFLLRQSPGQLKSDLYIERGWNTDEERRLFCITAIDQEGNQLWQVGEPHRGADPYCAHGGNDFITADVDGDGKAEVVSIVWDVLTVFDGETGEVQAKKKLPADNFSQVKAGSLRGDPTRQQLVVKVNDGAYPPYEYGNPTYVLDSDLSELWMTPHYHGAGHAPVLIDVDGDGCDEMLIGYNLVDSDGTLLWSIPVENATKEHADNINPVDLNGDGEIEIAYSGSKDFFVANTQGEVIWRRPHEHSQNTTVGRFRSDVDGQTMILNEKWIGMTCYTPDGQALWQKSGVGYAQHAVRGWRDDGLDLVIYAPALKKQQEDVPYHSEPEDTQLYWPFLMDGDGNRVMEFPFREDFKQPRQRIRGFRAYDYGIGYGAMVLDLDGDGRDEVLIYDRRKILVYGAPA